MKREEIKAIFENATDEQLDKVMSLNGADIEKGKTKVTALEAELNEKKQAFDNLTSEMETLKTNHATAEDYKTKFEQLQNEIAQKEQRAEADRLAKEKAELIANRFAAAVGDRKFNHEAIKADYLKKFGEALENKDFAGKSDSEIFRELTKDDGAAFQNVTAVHLAGGRQHGSDDETDTAKIKSIMGIK